MNREYIKKEFEKVDLRITIRKGPERKISWLRNNPKATRPITINVSMDKKGEHFTLTIAPNFNESEIELSVLDSNKKLRQMLLCLTYYIERPNGKGPKIKEIERLLLGHDEMHYFVAGVTRSNTIAEAFANLRPANVTLAMKRVGVKNKDKFRRKTKGFIRQGEWFFVPVHLEEKDIIIHKNEPILRRGGSPHVVEELVRSGGKKVYSGFGKILYESEWNNLPNSEKVNYSQRVEGAKVFARGKIKHKDHHTIILKGWHEVFLATEAGVSSNAFVD